MIEQIDAVKEYQEGSFLLDYYEACYLQRYKTKPVWTMSNNAQFVFCEAKRLLGMERAKLCINQYFKMSGGNDWYTKKGHSVDVFLKEINVINSSIRTNVVEHDSFAMNVRVLFICEEKDCTNYCEIICSPKELDSEYRINRKIFFKCQEHKEGKVLPMGTEFL